jgi:prepilin-type N-terminal cleavage/methylation domain-containing protein
MIKGFTLIEVIISVILVSIVVMSAMKLQDRNRDIAIYLSQRGNSELDNSLFLTPKVYKYNKDQRDAYELLRNEFNINNDKSKEVLKKIIKKINITEDKEIPISLEENREPIFTFYTNEILLKGKYPSRYYNFR